MKTFKIVLQYIATFIIIFTLCIYLDAIIDILKHRIGFYSFPLLFKLFLYVGSCLMGISIGYNIERINNWIWK